MIEGIIYTVHMGNKILKYHTFYERARISCVLKVFQIPSWSTLNEVPTAEKQLLCDIIKARK